MRGDRRGGEATVEAGEQTVGALAGFGAGADEVTGADFSGRFGWMTVHLDVAGAAGGGGDGAGFEQANGPEPFIQAHGATWLKDGWRGSGRVVGGGNGWRVGHRGALGSGYSSSNLR